MQVMPAPLAVAFALLAGVSLAGADGTRALREAPTSGTQGGAVPVSADLADPSNVRRDEIDDQKNAKDDADADDLAAAEASYDNFWLSAEEMEQRAKNGGLNDVADAGTSYGDMWLSAEEMEQRAKNGDLNDVANADSSYGDMWLSAEEMEQRAKNGDSAIAMEGSYEDLWASADGVPRSPDEQLELAKQIGAREWAEWFEAHDVRLDSDDGTSTAAISDSAGLAIGAALGFGASALLFFGGATALRHSRRGSASLGRPALRVHRQSDSKSKGAPEVQARAADGDAASAAAAQGGSGGLMSM